MKTSSKAKMVRVEDIRPYENNPRKIEADAVSAVKESISRYGYQQPIVVDSDLKVVVGHTRLLAVKELGIEKIEVYVTDLPEDKVREYRLIDNKTSELGKWDQDALVIELREFEEGLLEQFFPEVDLEIEAVNQELLSDKDLIKAAEKITKVKEVPEVATTEVECPSCYKVFKVRTSTLPGITAADLEER